MGPDQVAVLSGSSVRGFLTYGEGLRGFLQGRIPNDPLMTPPDLDVPMLRAER